MYVYDGFCSVESTTLSPLKSHAQLVMPAGALENELSVNCTFSGVAPPVTLAEKFANRPATGP